MAATYPVSIAIKVMCLMLLLSTHSFLNHILQMDLLGIFEIRLNAFHRIS
jgi:hypothetical protein